MRAFSFRYWTVDDRVARRLEGTCFHRFIGFPSFNQSHMFLDQIKSSYSIKDHTFVVGKSKTHLYLGLEDVYYLSGLPVDGLPIVCEAAIPTSLCRRLLDGIDDPKRSPTSVNLKLTWLRLTFMEVPPGLENEQLDVYVRAYVLYMIGTLMLLPDSYTDRVEIRYLQFLENLHPNSLNSYAWGAAVLASIHRRLRWKKTSDMGASWIVELFILERVPSVRIAYLKEQPELTKKFPAFFDWGNLLCKRSIRRMTNYWRNIFDNIQTEEIKWTPYERFSGIDKQRIFYSRTILLNFEKDVYHMPERAPLQLSITSMQEPLNDLKEKSRNGPIKEWCEHRYDAEACIIDTDEGFVLPDPPSEPCSVFGDSEGRAISMTEFLCLPTWQGSNIEKIKPNEGGDKDTEYEMHQHTINLLGPNEPISELTPEQLSVERPDSKAVREKERKKDTVALKSNSFKKIKTQDISKGPEGESPRSKKATKTDGQDSADDVEDKISYLCLSSEDDDGEGQNGSGSDYDGEYSKENFDAADKNDYDGEGDNGGDGERDDDGHGTGIPRDVTQSSFSHPENETHACLSKQASAEENLQQTLSNHQSIKRSYLYLSSYTDTLQRFEKLIADHEELVHTNDITEWEKEDYRRSLSSTSRKLERMTVEKEEAVEKCHGLEADLASTDARNKTLEQRLQDVTESNKQLEVRLQNQGKDLGEKDREIARLKEELEDAIIRAGNQEKQKQTIIRDLVPSVVNRLLQSAEYKASIGHAFSLSYGAGYAEVVKVARSDDDVKKILAGTKDLDLDAKEKFLKAYNELFTHQYPFVDKVASSFRLPLVDVLAIQPERPDEGSSSAP